jgi:hypothetical protein
MENGKYELYPSSSAGFPVTPLLLYHPTMEQPALDNLIPAPHQGVIVRTKLLDDVRLPEGDREEVQRQVDEVEGLMDELQMVGYHWPWKHDGAPGCTLEEVRRQLLLIRAGGDRTPRQKEIDTLLANYRARTLR